MSKTTVQIQSYKLTNDGLSISYVTSLGKSYTLIASPAATAELLENCDYIIKYSYRNDKLFICLEETESVVSKDAVIKRRRVGMKSIAWDYFARNFTISRKIAKELAEYHEAHEKTLVEIFA